MQPIDLLVVRVVDARRIIRRLTQERPDHVGQVVVLVVRVARGEVNFVGYLIEATELVVVEALGLALELAPRLRFGQQRRARTAGEIVGLGGRLTGGGGGDDSLLFVVRVRRDKGSLARVVGGSDRTQRSGVMVVAQFRTSFFGLAVDRRQNRLP